MRVPEGGGPEEPLAGQPAGRGHVLRHIQVRAAPGQGQQRRPGGGVPVAAVSQVKLAARARVVEDGEEATKSQFPPFFKYLQDREQRGKDKTNYTQQQLVADFFKNKISCVTWII